jgi:hypothetical protein
MPLRAANLRQLGRPVCSKLHTPRVRYNGPSRKEELMIVVVKGRTELLVQDNTKKRTMYLQSSVVVNEAQLSESVHEEIDA